ncbi:MAG TPA: M23 family metallopeptidase [Sphingomicrobium sp.]|jgi:murein DD-endopeptidase MepM/ murein hydrolase activator NlpD|nr:M23 family metallopeptidase [Sphingomicrobium sp.]
MAHALTTPTGLFRSRDLFVHDGAKLRRIRLSAPVQAAFFALTLLLVGWSLFAAARFIAGTPAAPAKLAVVTSSPDALAERALRIEQRQAVIESMLIGEDVDPELLAAAAKGAGAAATGPFAKLEAHQVEHAALVARALEARYEVTAQELKKLGLTPSKVGGIGGPLEPLTKAADPTFKALFNSWKKLDTLQDGVVAVPSDKPVKTAAFTSSYGVRSDPFQGRAAMHAGIDLSGPVGTPIYATADGMVSNAGWHNGGYGNLVKLDHGRGIETRYAHLSSLTVRPGQRVKRGDLIGKMGSTGRSTGSHLHYEVRIDGRAVNPIPFMKSTDYILALRHRSGSASMDAVALGGPTTNRPK